MTTIYGLYFSLHNTYALQITDLAYSGYTYVLVLGKGMRGRCVILSHLIHDLLYCVIKKVFFYDKNEKTGLFNFSSLKKSCFIKSVLLVNFQNPWYSNILNLLNISMMSNKSIIWCSLVGVTTSSQKFITRFCYNHYK